MAVMDPNELSAAASRLCTACGMCCNGVLFHIVRLGPQDSVKELEALGMKLGRKKREPYFRQPCAFLKECRCQIYAARPTRCREFECRQLHLLAAREVTEDEVMQLIDEVKTRVARIEDLLGEAGNSASDEPLAERCAQVLEAGESEDGELAQAMTGLSGMLSRNFRVQRPGGSPTEGASS